MKNEKNIPIDPIEKWIKEAGTDILGEEFHLSVLRKIEALPQTTHTYQPVISPLGWKLIIGFVASIFAWSVFFVPAQQKTSSLFDRLQSIDISLPSFNLYDITFIAPDFSPQFLMGIGAFFILGCIMIIGTIRNKHFGV